MIRLTIFIIALLLAAGAVDPTKALLVTLAVLSGIALFCARLPRFGWSRLRDRRRYEYDY
ncbi:MAG: hypothetical protein WEB04_00405 [Dehalococcoidia bacterium]